MATSTLQKRFIRERAIALAVVYLTRRTDLIVTEETADIGIDLWVSLDREKQKAHRKFGVELRGSWSAATAERASNSLASSMHHAEDYGPFPFPVVLFLFTMENNEGWYTWLAEPVVTPEADFKLVHHKVANCRPLSSVAIDEIVDVVDRWYDAFFERATRSTPGGKSEWHKNGF